MATYYQQQQMQQQQQQQPRNQQREIPPEELHEPFDEDHRYSNTMMDDHDDHDLGHAAATAAAAEAAAKAGLKSFPPPHTFEETTVERAPSGGMTVLQYENDRLSAIGRIESFDPDISKKDERGIYIAKPRPRDPPIWTNQEDALDPPALSPWKLMNNSAMPITPPPPHHQDSIDSLSGLDQLQSQQQQQQDQQQQQQQQYQTPAANEKEPVMAGTPSAATAAATPAAVTPEMTTTMTTTTSPPMPQGPPAEDNAAIVLVQGDQSDRIEVIESDVSAARSMGQVLMPPTPPAPEMTGIPEHDNNAGLPQHLVNRRNEGFDDEYDDENKKPDPPVAENAGAAAAAKAVIASWAAALKPNKKSPKKKKKKAKRAVPPTPPPQIDIASIDEDSNDNDKHANDTNDDDDDDDDDEKHLSMRSSVSSLSSPDKGPRPPRPELSPTKPPSELADIDLEDEDVHNQDQDHDEEKAQPNSNRKKKEKKKKSEPQVIVTGVEMVNENVRITSGNENDEDNKNNNNGENDNEGDDNTIRMFFEQELVERNEKMAAEEARQTQNHSLLIIIGSIIAILVVVAVILMAVLLRRSNGDASPASASAPLTKAPTMAPTLSNFVSWTVTRPPILTLPPTVAPTRYVDPNDATAQKDVCCPVGYTGYRPHDACTRFFNCQNGVVVGLMNTCPLGTWFDDAQQNCIPFNSISSTTVCIQDPPCQDLGGGLAPIPQGNGGGASIGNGASSSSLRSAPGMLTTLIGVAAAGAILLQ